MFDCYEDRTVIVDDAFCNAMVNIQKINVIGYCSRCKNDIVTTWDKGKLVGNFIATQYEHSEIFGERLPELDSLICYNCLSKSS